MKRRLVIAAVCSVASGFMAMPTADVAHAQSGSCPDRVETAFADVSGLAADAVDAIGCLVHYGITQGTSPDGFSPDRPVLRWQMAVFLVRQLEVHGVDVPAADSVGFSDLGGLSIEAQDAVNRLVRSGVAKGTSPTTFSPTESVSRWQMALFLKRTLIAVGVPVPTGATSEFEDLAGVPSDAATAIAQLDALGIASGFSGTEFRPLSDVLRWQMALFLSRVVEADHLDPGLFGYTNAFDKIGDTVGFVAAGGASAVSGIIYDGDFHRWRVGFRFFTTPTEFEQHLTLGDRIVWRSLANELWLVDRPFAGSPHQRTDTQLISLALADEVVSPLVNYRAKDLTAQLGLKTGANGIVKYRVGGSGAAASNLGLFEERVDDSIAAGSGFVTVSLEGPDLVWTVTSG